MGAIPAIKFDQAAFAAYVNWKEYRDVPLSKCPQTNFLKGAKWSPDGSCLLTASDDNCLRLYDLPGVVVERVRDSEGNPQPPQEQGAGESLSVGLTVDEGELIYDYCWYSAMSTADPVSCCFATTCRAHPIHLWDACSGQLRCTYRAYNLVDEVTAACSLAFSLNGLRLLSGHEKVINIFDVSRPGRDCSAITTYKKRQDGQPGLISCFAFNPDRSGVFAAGSYSGSTALYTVDTRETLMLMEGQRGGVTQVLFSPDGNYLYTGGRRDSSIMCWDVRFTHNMLYSLERSSSTTNQRIYFDIEPCGKHLATGGEDGCVRVFDLSTGEFVTQWQAAEDTVNGFQFHPYLPLAATASGHRRYPDVDSTDDDDDDDVDDDVDDADDNEHSSGAARPHGHTTRIAPACLGGTSGTGGTAQVMNQHESSVNALKVWQFQWAYMYLNDTQEHEAGQPGE